MDSNALPLLVIGNKNYSSWSLRAWLLLRVFGVPFRELKLPLDTPEFAARIGEFSPAGRVPALRDGGVALWDSLAIAEYANERWLGGRGWPAGLAQRAHARALAAEMHSGFSALRNALPFNCAKRVRAHRVAADAAADIERVRAIFAAAAGPFLFGAFGIVDAMYAPLVLRFVSYDVALAGAARAYADAVLALPALGEWLAEALDEPKSDEHERMKP